MAYNKSGGIEVVYFHGLEPSPGYTDFIRVYVSSSVPLSDQNVLLKHEKSHIYLQHLRRQTEIPNVDRVSWNIACDLEIALHIYDDADEAVLTSPTSLLAPLQPITKKTLADYPGCTYAEDFYPLVQKKLKEAPPNSIDAPWSHDAEHNIADGEAPSLHQKYVPVSKGELIEAAKKTLVESARRNSAATALQEAVRMAPAPSLSGELDRHLGRSASKRVASYRRPSRRPEGDFMTPGFVREKKVPSVNIYVDRSASFDAAKTAKAEAALKQALRKHSGRVECDVFYFSDCVTSNDVGQGGGTNYTSVWKHITDDMPELSVVITDSDYCPKLEKVATPQKVLVIHIGDGVSNFGRECSAVVVTQGAGR